MSSDSNWHSGVNRGAGSDLGDPTLRIGKYTIVKRIASGGMGSVYEAQQDQPRRAVALKLMHQVQHTPEQRDRFAREAELLGQLQHPNIAVIFDAGTHEEHGLSIPYIAMERVQGGRSIGAHCKENKLQWTNIVELMVGVADALAYAHGRGVLHRDLKPANILVDQDGVPKIIDFGVGKFADHDANSPITEQSLLVGTLQYMSPEQAARGEFDERSDQYSFAMVLYELLCGQLPYTIDRSRVVQATETIASVDPVPPVKLNATVPPNLSNVVLKALSKEAHDRYASMGDLAERLRRVLRGEDMDDTPVPRWTILLRRLKRVGFHRPIATIVLASVIGIAVGYIGGESANDHNFHRMYERTLVTRMNHVPDAPFRDVPIIAITDSTDLDRLAHVAGIDPFAISDQFGLRLAYGRLLERLSSHRPKVVSMDLVVDPNDTNVDQLVRGAEALKRSEIPLVVGVRKFDGGVHDPKLMPQRLAELATAGITALEGGRNTCWSLYLAAERRGTPPRAGLALATFARFHGADPSRVKITQGTLGLGEKLEFPYSVPIENAQADESFGLAVGDLLANYIVELPATDVLMRNVIECSAFFELTPEQVGRSIDGKVVMIADMRVGKDQHPYPDGRTVPGVFAHAAGVQGLFNGQVIRTVYPLRVGRFQVDGSHIVLIVAATAGALSSVWSSSRQAWFGCWFALASMTFLGSCASYQWHGWIWSPLPPLIAITLGWFIVGFARSAPT